MRRLNDLFCMQNGVKFELGFKDLHLKGIEFVMGGKRGKKLIIVQMYTAQIKEAAVSF